MIGAIDQGTSSTRVIIYDKECKEVIASAQQEIRRIVLPGKSGWVEVDAMEILESVYQCMAEVERELKERIQEIKGIGITNQRESVLVWDRATGTPQCNAILWLDTRTEEVVSEILSQSQYSQSYFRERCGLPLSTYFTAPKVYWLLKQHENWMDFLEKGEFCIGTIDSWLVYKLTSHAKHVTDITNASRTMLMNIHTLQWDADLLQCFRIPLAALPTIHSCCDDFGSVSSDCPFKGIPICAILGDQHAALVGQGCYETGEGKCTFGTGAFLLRNTGNQLYLSEDLLTTVGYQLGANQPVYYALEGSIANAGLVITWLKEGLKILPRYEDIDAMVPPPTPPNPSLLFLPAFNGLFAPHWLPGIRGTLTGIDEGTTAAHIVQAALQGVALQVKDVIGAMSSVFDQPFPSLRIDGGLTQSNAFNQLLATVLGVPIEVCNHSEATAQGAALAASYQLGYLSRLAPIQQPSPILPDPLQAETYEELEGKWHALIASMKQDK